MDVLHGLLKGFQIVLELDNLIACFWGFLLELSWAFCLVLDLRQLFPFYCP